MANPIDKAKIFQEITRIAPTYAERDDNAKLKELLHPILTSKENDLILSFARDISYSKILHLFISKNAFGCAVIIAEVHTHTFTSLFLDICCLFYFWIGSYCQWSVSYRKFSFNLWKETNRFSCFIRSTKNLTSTKFFFFLKGCKKTCKDIYEARPKQTTSL